MVSETLANAAKHSQASQVEVRVEANQEHLQLTIKDDGIGGAHRDHGSGLIGLADRVEALGGTIAIASPTGQGTSIHVQLPAPRDTPKPQPVQRGRYECVRPPSS